MASDRRSPPPPAKSFSSLNQSYRWVCLSRAHEIGLARLKTRQNHISRRRSREPAGRPTASFWALFARDYPPRAEGGINVSGELRITLDLYANIRPSRSREGLPYWGRTPMDLVIVRENTEGFYADRNMYWGVGEFMPTPDMALAVRKITAASSRRIAQAAFELAASAPQESDRGAQSERHEGFRRAVPARGAGGRRRTFPGLPTKSSLWTRWRRFWCATPRDSMWWSPPTCSEISCRTKRRNSPAAWAWPARSTRAMRIAWPRRSTARRRILPDRTRRIRRR